MSTAESTQDRKLPLSSWHESKGAHWISSGGFSLPAHYGDPLAEARSMAGACALVDRSDAGRLELVGEDRVRFLNGLVTCDVAALEEGAGSYGFFTTPKGRILADVVVLALTDRLWLELPPGSEEAVREHLQKYIVADRVEVRSIADLMLCRIVGPDVSKWLESRGQVAPVPFGHGEVDLDGTEAHASWSALCGAPALSLWISSGIANEVIDDILRGGVELAGHLASEAVRIRAGIPRFGIDYDQENLPQETRIDMAVSYDKGCYLGQEIVARLHYRGQPAREIRRVEGAGAAPARGSELYDDDGGKVVARITSAVGLPEPATPGRWCGLAMVDRKGLGASRLSASGESVRLLEPLPIAAR